MKAFALACLALWLTTPCGVSAQPKFATLHAMIEAGGGADEFKTTTLVGVLTEAQGNAEFAKLTKQYGAARVKQFIVIFDFVIADTLGRLKKSNIRFPDAPEFSSADGKALAATLYSAGLDRSTGRYDVEIMLDALLSHPLQVQIMNDVDAQYGATADAAFHALLRNLIRDLK